MHFYSTGALFYQHKKYQELVGFKFTDKKPFLLEVVFDFADGVFTTVELVLLVSRRNNAYIKWATYHSST